MSIGICTACGRSGPIENHHVAGRANHPALVIGVCQQCHRGYLTPWQHASGVELGQGAPREAVDIDRALADGLFRFLALVCHRTGGRLAELGWNCVLSARGFTALLDNIAAPERAGRWTPDPRAPLPVPEPVEPAPGTIAERTRRFAEFMLRVADTFGYHDDGLTDVLVDIHIDPVGYVAAWELFVTILTGTVGRQNNWMQPPRLSTSPATTSSTTSSTTETMDSRPVSEAGSATGWRSRRVTCPRCTTRSSTTSAT